MVGASVLAALIGGGWLFFGHNGEPRYEGKPVNYWFKEYYSPPRYAEPDSDNHQDALNALRAMGSNALPYLVQVAFSTNQDSASRTNFYNLLSKLPESWHLPRLVTKDEIREASMEVIREIRPSARDILPFIRSELEETNTSQYTLSIFLLGYASNDVELAVPYLAKALHDTNSENQNHAIWALTGIGSKAAPAVPDLIKIFKDAAPTGRIRPDVSFVLGDIGSNAASAIPLLMDAMDRETNWAWRGLYATCVCKIDPKQPHAFDFLIDILTNKADSDQVQFAAGRLADIGSNAQFSIPIVLNVLLTGDYDADTVRRSTASLRRLGASNELILPMLKAKLDSSYADVRDYAANQILDLEATNHEAKMVLIESIGKNAPSAPQDIDHFGEMGPMAKEALPVLREALKNTNADIWARALFAIRKIDPKNQGK